MAGALQQRAFCGRLTFDPANAESILFEQRLVQPIISAGAKQIAFHAAHVCWEEFPSDP
jgi:hypothetical protein